jgi:L-aminopeptidase/D-esterase-like protein
MTRMRGRAAGILLLAIALLPGAAFAADQSGLTADTAIHGAALRFDWPDILIGVGSYEAGPTGMTIIRFAHRAAMVVDSRGGAPGTVNTDLMRLGYDRPIWDGVVFAGGSSYGEEAIASVASGLKDAGIRSGRWGNIGLVAGAVIYDLGSRRLNQIYPDKALARATLAAMRAGVFPLGAQGAGRMAIQGGFFGCDAHSGQGAAFRQFGDVKIAAFVVVNASGAVTDRDGNLVSCHRAAAWGNVSKTSELMANLPFSRTQYWHPPAEPEGASRNTTISLIVTNQRLNYAGLERLAIEVHTSMARAIQPFSTSLDGDTLFAASTEEVGVRSISALDLDAVASELMWNAILASVPPQTPFTPPAVASVPEETLRHYVGTYEFGEHVRLQITEAGDRLSVLALDRPVFAFSGAAPVAVVPESQTEFYAPGRYPTRIAFQTAGNGVTGAILDPGPWQQAGIRLDNDRRPVEEGAK